VKAAGGPEALVSIQVPDIDSKASLVPSPRRREFGRRPDEGATARFPRTVAPCTPALFSAGERGQRCVDTFGGWKTTRYDATGFFYPRKINDRWWLIDPEGHRFLHLAVNSVSPGRSPTNRETLPKKFGSRENWRDQTIALLRDHGFNGTGNWSDDELLRTAAPRLVYTPRLNFMGSYGRKTGRVVQEPGHLGYPNKCVFVFDPQFEQHADNVAAQAAAWKDDPYLLGYFTDNELPFPADLLDRYLGLDASDPGHQAAQRWLKQQGGSP